jgi:hypothetical protein
MKLLLILTLSINSCFAIDITQIKKGESAPADGFFVDSENMKKFRQINEDKKVLEQKTLKLEDLQVVNEQRVKFYQDQSETAYKEASKAQLKGLMGTLGGFTVGIGITVISVYLASKLVK